MRAKLSIASSALAAILWAVPNSGAAPFIAKTAARESRSSMTTPLPVRFSVQKERGLLVRAWINGTGPYVFAVDTGAGMNLITERVVSAARLPVNTVAPALLGGLTAARTSSNREAVIRQMALGNSTNFLPANKTALVVSYLPPDIDGILDPTEAYSPFGYSIDIPNQRLEALDVGYGLSQGRQTSLDSAVVPWLRVGDSNRPFVRLGDGRLALVDTGSGFGLAVNERGAVIVSNGRRSATEIAGLSQDIGGGSVHSRRVSPTTISIGELVLRSVPTEVLFGVEDDAPVVLGRAALYPFKITFDPRRRLIEFVTSESN
ncbi:MAG TPA: hypothetical protein DHU55_17415 [Blastocatellia bacterium]|nr:hypothetical protein [Blastocatellia bacterium]